MEETRDTFAEEYINKKCESANCNIEIFATFVKCLSLLCFHHFDQDDECSNHNNLQSIFTQSEPPHDYSMEGSLREEPRLRTVKENKDKFKKEMGNKGNGYYTHRASLNLVASREVKDRCKCQACLRSGTSVMIL